MFEAVGCVLSGPCDGSVVAAVAGHPPPLYWDHAQGRLVVVRDHGPTLGLGPDWGGPTARGRLAPRDTLLLYTDGGLDAKVNQEGRLGVVPLAERCGRGAPAGAHEVAAFVRSPEKLPAEDGRLRCVTGDPLNPEELVDALPGHNALLSAVGPRGAQSGTLQQDRAGAQASRYPGRIG